MTLKKFPRTFICNSLYKNPLGVRPNHTILQYFNNKSMVQQMTDKHSLTLNLKQKA